MNARPLPLILEPALAEEAVLHASAGHPEERAFRRARDQLYLLPEGDARERAFHEFHATWFTRLGLDRPVRTALAELPILSEHCARCLVTGAVTRRDEGADLLVSAAAHSVTERTVLLRLRPGAFGAPDRLLSLLRAELLHVADMVDPAFGYRPALRAVDGGPSYEALLRERYRVLWDVRVAGRLERRGLGCPGTQAQAYDAFSAAFPMLGPAADETFMRFFGGDARTHDELVAFAAQPRVEHVAQGLVPGGRCPLCRFSTFAPEPDATDLPRAVIAEIIADFSAWRPGEGLCRQCADLYRARGVSHAAMEIQGDLP